MNEPAGFLGDNFTNVLKQYYIDSYDAIRATAGNGTGVMFSEGFRGLDVSTPPSREDAFTRACDSTTHTTVLGKLL